MGGGGGEGRGPWKFQLAGAGGSRQMAAENRTQFRYSSNRMGSSPSG